MQMLRCVGYVRPRFQNCDSDKLLEETNSRPDSAISSFVARCLSAGPWASMFASEKRPQPYEKAPPGKILEILRVRNRFAMKKGDPHWSGGFRDLAFKVKVGFQVPIVDAVRSSAFRTVSTLQRCACRSLPAARRVSCRCTTLLLACDCSFIVVAVGFLLQLRCRNRWGDSYVKTFVCELQIHHQVSDATKCFCNFYR
jgi:hypothetical protein